MSMSNPASKEIFIVDDDPLVLNALSIVLSREGYEVRLSFRDLDPDDVVKWAGQPLAVVDCYGMLSDDKIRRYFELGCEVKALGRGHVQRLKEEVRHASRARPRDLSV